MVTRPLGHRNESPAWIRRWLAGCALCAALQTSATAAVFTVTNTADAGSGSLRAAAAAADALAGADEIRFALPGTGPHQISLASALSINSSVLIDGYSQTGAFANTNTPDQGGLNGNPLVEISRSGVGGSGIVFAGQSGSALTLRGLVINRFATLIAKQGGGSLNVEGCYLGTDVAGATVPSPVDLAVELQLTVSDRIGGTLPEQRNLISGAAAGLSSAAINTVIGANCSSVIQGNLIGTDRTGNFALANRNGIVLGFSEVPLGTTGLVIGGVSSAARNVISGNLRAGIDMSCASTGAVSCAQGTLILGNYIGTRADGIGALGNGSESARPGISFYQVSNSPTRVQIGGFAPGAGNTIAYNSSFGIDHGYTNGHGTLVMLGNQIFGNGTRGIATAGRTNDPGDVDEGVNRRQNFPVFVSGSRQGDQIAARYRVDSAVSNASYPLTVHFYRSRGGSGDFYLGQQVYNTPQLEQDVVIPLPPGLALGFVVALATDAAGNTSEFSDVLAVDALFANGFEGGL